MRVFRGYIGVLERDLARLDDNRNNVQWNWNWHDRQKKENIVEGHPTIRPGYGLSPAHFKLLRGKRSSMRIRENATKRRK